MPENIESLALKNCKPVLESMDTKLADTFPKQFRLNQDNGEDVSLGSTIFEGLSEFEYLQINSISLFFLEKIRITYFINYINMGELNAKSMTVASGARHISEACSKAFPL
uniref:Ovule protein n=1 Tax=Rhabditophanes sp. KR3021 TaxID=114890 RepID=A0AC35TJG9_9BILA